MQAKSEIQQGWDFMAQILAAEMGSQRAFSDFANNAIQNESIQAQNAHIQQINDAIDQLAKNINEHPHLNLDVEQFKGYVAEEMHAGTFNIDDVNLEDLGLGKLVKNAVGGFFKEVGDTVKEFFGGLFSRFKK